MTVTDKLVCQAAALLVLFALTLTPARAQFGGGQDMMTQMAPMLEMMKAKMGKKRFAALMQTMGPMVSRMQENGGGFGGGLGGLGGMMGGGGIPNFGGGDAGGFNIGGIGGGELMSMVPQLVSLANIGGGRHGRRHKKR